MQNQNNDIKAQVFDVVSVTLGVDRAQITDDFSAEHCDAWDSIRHLTMILAIEDSLGVVFDEQEIQSLFTVDALVKAVETRRGL